MYLHCIYDPFTTLLFLSGPGLSKRPIRSSHSSDKIAGRFFFVSSSLFCGSVGLLDAGKVFVVSLLSTGKFILVCFESTLVFVGRTLAEDLELARNEDKDDVVALESIDLADTKGLSIGLGGGRGCGCN